MNQTGVPIRSVHIETPSGRDYEVRSMTFDRASKAEVVDQDHGYRIFALEKYRGSGPPYPTSLDLYAELRAVTPPSLHSLLTDLFETITLWDVKTQSAAARRLPGGKYEVTLEVMAQKLRADGIGVEKATPMNDLVQIDVFAPGKKTFSI